MNVREMVEAIPEKYPTSVFTAIDLEVIDTFVVVLTNGWMISVGYGKRHYSDARLDNKINPADSRSVEVAIFEPSGKWHLTEGMIHICKNGTGVLAWQTSKDLFQIIDYLSLY